MPLKYFLMICSFDCCIFGFMNEGETEPFKEIENVMSKEELNEYMDGVVVDIHPYNDNKIAVTVIV